MSDLEDPREDGTANRAAREPSAAASAPASVAGDSAAAGPVNPRKRKKSSRACDFCHVNHQPCDNAKPRCSYCEKHNKSCLYLRPQKKRGPAQGYRSALHTLRESAAAWGAALNLIPSLGPVVEGYLKQPEGRRLIKVIKDPAQQEFFIQAWQQSGVFRTFFGDDGSEDNTSTTPPDGAPMPTLTEPSAISVPQVQAPSNQDNVPPASGSVVSPPPPPPAPQLSHGPQLEPMAMPEFEGSNPFNFGPTPSPSSHDGNSRPRPPSMTSRWKQRTGSISFSDIMASDAARSPHGFSQTLGSLGFAPNETLEDFLDMSFNPEPIEQPVEQDNLLGSEDDQKAYYELLMGRRFG